MFTTNVPWCPDNVTESVPKVRRKKRRKYTLYHSLVQEMLDSYSGGMPINAVCLEYNIHHSTLERLIREYEAINGEDSLRNEGL